MNINRAEILGRVTRDPELRQTAGGQAVASFGVATNRSYTDKEGQKKEDTEFHNVVFWGKSAEIIARYSKKGQLIFVAGRLKTREWEKNGQKMRTTEVIGEEFQFGPRTESRPAAAAGTGRPGPGRLDEPMDIHEEIPESEIKPEEIPF